MSDIPGHYRKVIMDCGWRTTWDGADHAFVLEATREVRPDRLAWSPEEGAALRRLLVDQGYSLTDVGAMLGLTRERVRQLADRFGIEREPGAKLRLWDDRRNRFVPATREEVARRMRQTGYAHTREDFFANVLADRQRRMAEDVEVVRAVGRLLGRSPMPTEVAAFDVGFTSKASWWSIVGNRWNARSWGYARALDLLWAAAGYQHRTDGREMRNGT